MKAIFRVGAASEASLFASTMFIPTFPHFLHLRLRIAAFDGLRNRSLQLRDGWTTAQTIAQSMMIQSLSFPKAIFPVSITVK